jgi:hypothetical protein
MPGSSGPILWWLIGGDCRKIPFNDQLRRSSKIAATAAIFDLVSIDFLTNNAWVRLFGGSLGVTGGRFLSMNGTAVHPTWPPPHLV